MPRVTIKKTPREKGLAGVCQAPRGYEISITGYGQVACVFALNKGYHKYDGWTYLIYKIKEFNLPRIEAWCESGVVPEGKIRRFRFTEEGKDAAKKLCVKRIKEFLQKKEK